MADEIAELLDAYNAVDLKSMASEAGIVPGGRAKRDDVVLALHQQFFAPERIRSAYAKLTATEKEVLNRILLHPMATPTRILRRELVKAKLVTEAPEPKEETRLYYSREQSYTGSPGKRRSTIFEDVMARFTLYGLVFSQIVEGRSGQSAKQRFNPGSLLFVPKVVRQVLPEPTPIPLETSDLQPERMVAGDPNSLLRDLYLYWDYARRGGINLLNSGAVGKRELKVLNGLMLISDPAIDTARKEEEMGHLYLLRLLLEGLGLLKRASGQLRPATGDSLEIAEFWRGSTGEQMLACVKQWILSTGGAETVNLYSEDVPQTAHARWQLVQMLLALHNAEWVSVDDLLENFWAIEVGFLYAMHEQAEDSDRWYGGTFQGSYFYGKKEELLRAIEASERTFIEKCLDESLFLLGLVDRGVHLAKSGKEQKLYRLSERGRRVVSAYVNKSSSIAEAQAAPSDIGRILIQPNFHIVAMGPVPIAVLAQLDLFALRLQVGVGAFEYELTKESVYQAQQNGLEAEQINRFLVEMCGVPLPQNVARTLQEWAQHHERIVFRTGVDLLQTVEPALLEKLLALPAVAAQVERALTPSLALLQGSGSKGIVTELQKEDYLPVVADARPVSADKKIRIDEKGRIALLHPFPNLFLEGRLAKVAEFTPKGGWQLTEAGVRRAGGSRSKVTELLAELTALSQSSLPAGVVEQVKAWGHYYGSAGIAQVTLIEFQSRAVLDELLKMADLHKRLRAFDDKQPLAIVDEKEVAQVKKTLARLGVTTKNGISRA